MSPRARVSGDGQRGLELASIAILALGRLRLAIPIQDAVVVLTRTVATRGAAVVTRPVGVFTGASSVTVTRYRYRGSRIPTPWTIDPAAVATG